MIMDETSPDLKDAIGAGAYFIAAAKALGRTPIDMRITLMIIVRVTGTP